ncbi:competence protein ComEC [Hathewaya proteolytica DSM 3090]|uniref:Competence protein ComEC n=1 Tax=Hathewaya proteolytica DSM 3090 TaxID=1121331 RepID=A0A1M6KNR3_9CLOT|nr:ComEC/Rec2 family competence protein [Hathewaya proteolytica]SHJ60587.1 competence protein ComEC [Hathewaya proteolytica DSM 3090]
MCIINKKRIYAAISVCLALVAFLYYYSKKDILDCLIRDKKLFAFYENNLSIHYINVGQGDCELIRYKDKVILIDAGPKEAENTLINYLKKCKISEITCVIATHPHEDHIGNMSNILNTFKVKKFIAPKVSTNTNCYKKMIAALRKQNLKITPAHRDLKLDFGDLHLDFLAPYKEEYDNLNNYSAVVKLSFKNTSYLFTGDAEKLSESEMLSSGINLKSTVLKLGHHGSNTATTLPFLKKVDPSVAIVSCGKNNTYNHPSKETLQKLISSKTKVFRTDVDGTILLISDGNIIKKLTLNNFI